MSKAIGKGIKLLTLFKESAEFLERVAKIKYVSNDSPEQNCRLVLNELISEARKIKEAVDGQS